MFSGKFGRRTLTFVDGRRHPRAGVPAFAQTGRIQGKVVDDKDAPVPDAKILVTAIPDQGGQKWEAKSDKNGNYIIGTLPKSGQYLIVASKEGVGEDEARATVKLGNFTTLNFKLSSKPRASATSRPRRTRRSRSSSRTAWRQPTRAIIRRPSTRSPQRATRCPPAPTATSTSAYRSRS